MGAMAHVQHEGMSHRHQQRCGHQGGHHPAGHKPASPLDRLGTQQQQQQHGDVDRRKANASAVGQQFSPEGGVAHQNRPSAGAFQRRIAWFPRSTPSTQMLPVLSVSKRPPTAPSPSQVPAKARSKCP